MANGRGGKRPGSGKPKGTKNKKTLLREAAEALAKAGMAPEQITAEITGAARAATPEKIGVDTLRKLTSLFVGLAAVYQPKVVQGADGKPALQGGNEGKFVQYAELGLDAANKLAAFESPKFSAVAIQAQMVSKVEVTGGMPDDFAPPASSEGGKVIELKPGTVITADDDAPAAAGDQPRPDDLPDAAASA